MEARVHRVLIWSGPAMIAVWLGAFLFIAGFIPPSRPSASAAEIVRLYADHSIAIKLGMVISMAGSALLVPWAIAISGQIRRIDGAKALADVQMVSCALLSLEFITPIGVWMAVSFRYDDRAPDVTRALHDLGWILFMTVIWSLWVQLLAIAAAILIDRRSEPVLPRWLGYLSLWVAMLIIPAGLVLFFKHGPFAWNGVVGLYIPLTAFVIWVMSMTITIHQKLSREIGADTRAAEPVSASA
ncbi:hypothetical protein BN1232_03966 [Mycobacterium lentiflavum]|uniref:DUF4386 domain-containing protein n=1 Tax=Mycobacterium lentiflavum TaxID=141349 RepID=A0A0E4GZI0_MYCLN|nr:hypothetical protein [Mycobacterium lentiflavum]CQD17652.1 hypothetical protein BN1232_03966 [Mycobacterium lentiflavum]